MKTRRLLCTLLTLTLILTQALPAALAVESVPLGDREGFSIDLPEGWVLMDVDLRSSSILGFTPGALYDFTLTDSVYRAFVLHIVGFSSPITLSQVQRYLADDQIVTNASQLNGADVLEGYVSALGAYGVVFLDQEATGYYIIGAVYGQPGGLEAQAPFVQQFFCGIRIGDQAADMPAAGSIAVAPAAGSTASAASVADLQAQLADTEATIAQLYAYLDDLAMQQKTAESQLAEAVEKQALLLQMLDEAVAHGVCQNCGFQFPEGSNYKFCPECGTPR